MGSFTDKISELQALKSKILEQGGEKNVAKHKEKGKLTARERLNFLFDADTFREVDMFVTHRCVNFGMEDIEIPSDGVVTGYGYVDGRSIFAYAQDFTSRAGSLGEMHAKKICKIMDMAQKAGAPVIGMNDSGGARRKLVRKTAPAVNDAHNQNAMLKVPVISAMKPATAGPVICPTPKNRVINPNAFTARTGPV